MSNLKRYIIYTMVFFIPHYYYYYYVLFHRSIRLSRIYSRDSHERICSSLLIQRTFNVMRRKRRRVYGEKNIKAIIITTTDRKLYRWSVLSNQTRVLCLFNIIVNNNYYNRIKRGRLINSYYVRLIV